MSDEKIIDLLGIGNAITDILVKVDYQFIEKMNLNIGAMQLTNYDTINETIKKYHLKNRYYFVYYLWVFGLWQYLYSKFYQKCDKVEFLG